MVKNETQFCERTLFAMNIAKQAGNKIKKIQKGDLGTTIKGLNDVLTIADVASETLIVNAIKKHFPNDGIIGEEGTDIATKSGFTWCIDPLDGTMNYSHKLPLYTVSVGYLKDGKPYGGAIFVPELKQLYYTEKGLGAWCNDTKISVSNVNDIQKCFGVFGFNNRYPEMRELYTKFHSYLMNNALMPVHLFSATLQLCFLASGKYDFYADIYYYAWDLCVGSLLVKEAGGTVTQFDGTEPHYMQKDKHLIIATNGRVHENFVKILDEVQKQVSFDEAREGEQRKL